MKKISILFLFFISCLVFSQSSAPNKSSDLYKTAPEWAKLMYTDNPNVDNVDNLYKAYFRSASFKKTFHTQYYKRWRKAINNFIGENGFYDPSKKLKLRDILYEREANNDQDVHRRVGNWSVLGPFQNFKQGGVVSSGAQANVYSIGQCAAIPSVMYCGTENGEVYKTLNGGDSWVNVSLNLLTALAPQVVLANAGIAALTVHPTNPDVVYIGSGSEIFKTIDGGINWNVVFDSAITLSGYIENPAEIFINPNNPQIVLVASKAGMHRSTSGGASWSQVLNFECFDVKAQPGNPNTLYTIRRNNNNTIHQFLRSTDAGLTWTAQTTGWYTSTNPNRSVVGARIAVTNADNQRVYAYLIGDSKPEDNGFIGIYRSDDGGTSWTNTMTYDGAPYTDPEHPNLISSTPVTNNFSFNQGFYNCAIMASNTNADELLVGGIGMWRSSDGGQSFQCIFNYGCGDYNPMHVDMQDFRAFGNEYWASTDGGIYKSLDLFNSQPEFKMNGVHGVDFWGFGSGWNNDLLIGGTFHNGVDVYYEGFPNGAFLDLGGGEPASGYVNPGNDLRIYSENIGSKIIPQSITGAVINAPMGLLPTESPWFAESSEMEFHPSCYNHVYLGNANQLFKSIDGGANYSAVYTSASPSNDVLGIEISRTNTNTMYVVERVPGSTPILMKTTNDWETSSTVSLPTGSNFGPLAIISMDPENDQIIWLAYPRGNDGNKIFKSINGGASWANETSSELDAQNIQDMTTIGGTDGGVYISTSASVYYKNNTMSSWAIDNANLPATIGTQGIRPFYRDGKIRLASYGKGLWESPLFETPSRPVAKIMVDKLAANCINDIFYFDDYSMLDHDGATWAWTFDNGTTPTSNLRNPQVTFTTTGSHVVTLTVTNAAGIQSSDSITVDVLAIESTAVMEDFETEFVPQNWTLNTTGNFTWTYNNTVGGFGTTTNSMSVNNFVVSDVGAYCDAIIPINLSNTSTSNSTLTFDVAYALYADNYADALEVLVSTDCGETYTSVYNKLGADLATAPNTTEQFVPTADQWRTESIDLSAYIGSDSVFIAFRNINGYGQVVYVDNINLGSTLGVEETILNTLTVFPNPVSSSGALTVKNNLEDDIEFKLFSIQGKLVGTRFTQSNTPIPLAPWNLSTGVYLYSIRSSNKIQKGKIIVANRE
ncbi:T9SS type A sorting domain-containing protein [Psychroserpens burtonensis]|uniref:T9SS type A sorting domain-containing protein n=1 Tax=Psychroserpens burtonensis TaxID=49278 RepID=UPI0004013866|nr:T9SS type A sorting domain-containing protein [Psychroserpens burtonensis]